MSFATCPACFRALEAPDNEGFARCPGGHGYFKCGYCEGQGALDIDSFRDLPPVSREDSDALLDMIAASESSGLRDRSAGR